MDLKYKDTTEKLIGAILRVYNTLGYGYQEKEYQSAYAEELKLIPMRFSRELYAFLRYNGNIIRKNFLDFLVEDNGVKIVVELKVANSVYKQHFTQVLQYLQNNKVELGLLFVVTPRQVIIKRIINEVSAASA